MKSLSSSRREVLVDCFHVHACHISHLLPGSAVLQHSAAPLHNLRGHYPAASTHYVCDPTRTRKLLLNQRELDTLYGRINREGYTVVALSLYWKNAWCKVKIGVAKGKKQHDKRTDLKDREWALDKARIMKHAGR